MGKAFGEGDVVGVHLYLPPGGRRRARVREACTWGRKVFWMQEGGEEEGRQLKGSFVAFYLNGVKQGEVRDVLEGTYFPALSFFTLPKQEEPVVVRCNFGATEMRFQPLPQTPTVWKPWTDAAAV
jgi:hypothetical protein